MRKPHENKPDGRGGSNPFIACDGSFEEPLYVQESMIENGPPAGSCPLCGKWCKLRFGRMPRHKPLSKVVQEWDGL